MIVLQLLVRIMVQCMFYLIYLLFDSIDHTNLFCILGKHVRICGNALKLIK